MKPVTSKTLFTSGVKYLLFLFLFLFPSLVTGLQAQTFEWVWMNGQNTIDPSGVYGTAGTAASTNTPGGRYYASNWLDANGYFWLYGGAAYDASGNIGFINDLWKYNPSTNQWAWINGGNAINTGTVYGTEGTAAATNTPGARFGSVSVADANGNLWLFGGGSGTTPSAVANLYNDLWKYNIATGLWTWVSGSSAVGASAVYGTKQVSAAANVPGARYGASSARDASGNFWLFGGGFGTVASTITSFYDDLWEYTPSTGLWTWVSGTSSANQDGVYGTMGTAATTNYPGGRRGAVNWMNAGAGTISLLGGLGYSATGTSADYLDDFWTYNIAARTWTWVGGDNSAENDGIYGTMGTPSSSNKPGSRYAASTWIDAAANLWLLGGRGYPATGTTVGYMNDLWKLENVTLLAVTWLGFTGIASGNHSLLNWETSGEQTVGNFIIQRSDDDTNWENIGTVAAAGNGAIPNSYRFIDRQPLASLNFYRLQLNDGNEALQYSQTITIRFTANPVQTLNWYVLGQGAVQATLKNGSSELYRLLDMQGRLLRQGSLQNGEIGFSQLVPGTYVLQVMARDGMLLEKMIAP